MEIKIDIKPFPKYQMHIQFQTFESEEYDIDLRAFIVMSKYLGVITIFIRSVRMLQDGLQCLIKSLPIKF